MIHFGLGQHPLLALLMLWTVFMTVSAPAAVTTVTVVSLTVACLTTGVLRLNAVSAGVS